MVLPALASVWLPALAVVHASFSHAQFRRLHGWAPMHYALDDRGRAYAQRAGAFVACDEGDRLHYFLHVNHTLYCCRWATEDERCNRALELARLRRWHREAFGFAVASALADAIDAEAWARTSDAADAAADADDDAAADADDDDDADAADAADADDDDA